MVTTAAVHGVERPSELVAAVTAISEAAIDGHAAGGEGIGVEDGGVWLVEAPKIVRFCEKKRRNQSRVMIDWNIF